MKRLVGNPFDQWRDRSAAVLQRFGTVGDEGNGIFHLTLPSGMKARVLASTGRGWDHLSVTVRAKIDVPSTRCPTWDEMVFIKRAFFEPHEWAVEYHPPQSQNISVHPFCLHLWRCQYADMPLPEEIQI